MDATRWVHSRAPSSADVLLAACGALSHVARSVPYPVPACLHRSLHSHPLPLLLLPIIHRLAVEAAKAASLQHLRPELRPSLNRDLAALIVKCWHPDPRERWVPWLLPMLMRCAVRPQQLLICTGGIFHCLRVRLRPPPSRCIVPAFPTCSPSAREICTVLEKMFPDEDDPMAEANTGNVCGGCSIS